MVLKSLAKNNHHAVKTEQLEKEEQCEHAGLREGKPRDTANLVTSPELSAMRVISISEGTTLAEAVDMPTLLEELRGQVQAINDGDLKRVEAVLASQSTALQTLFARLTEKAFFADSVGYFEVYMKLALRAQSQCRATLETLAVINSPPVLFAQQANVTTGPQQINNGGTHATRSRKIRKSQNQQSGGGCGLLPHARTSTLEVRVNQEMETMAKIHRAEDS